MHAKCVAFGVHQYRDIWTLGDDKTAARHVIKWDTTEAAIQDMITPASSPAFLTFAGRYRSYRINGLLIEYKPFRILVGSQAIAQNAKLAGVGGNIEFPHVGNV